MFDDDGLIDARGEGRRRVDDLMPGRFVFHTVNNIEADVPPQMIMAI